MRENEGNSAAKAEQPRTLQACQRCRNLKTKCLPSSQSGRCQKCSTSGNECVWADAPRRARKLRAPSRIAQVEQTIDGLVAKLVCASGNEITASSGFIPPAVPPKTTRPVVTGGWMSVESQSEARLRRTSDDAEVDRQYLEEIRGIHGFDDRQTAGQPSEGPFRQTKRLEDPIDDELVRSLLVSGEAESLMKEFRSMSITFPFVVISQQLSSTDLHAERPMLFLAIMTAASWKDYSQQRRLDTIYRTELAHRTMVRPRKTLGLVQSVLVYLSWYHFVFSHKTQQIFFLHHLVIGLALDIGLHQDYQPIDFTPPLRGRPSPPSRKDLRERQRTFLGCYYISSMVGGAFQKPNLLKHTHFMTEAAESLGKELEYESDEVISHLISLRQIEEQIQDILFTADTAQLSLSDGRMLMHLRSIEGQLDAWKARSCCSASQRLLELSFSFSKTLLHSISLRPHALNVPPPPQSAQLNSLFSALEAGKKFLDTLLSFPANEYHFISFSEWMRLPSVIMTVARLCMPNDDHAACGWDAQAAQERVRLELCLESLCFRMQKLSTYDEVKQPHSDFWRAMCFMMDLTKTWYIRKIRPKAPMQKPMQSPLRATTETGTAEASCPISAMSTVCPMHGSEAQYPALADANFTCEGSAEMDGAPNGSSDPFALMRSADFDIEQFFDMAGGIWGDQCYDSYSDMAFGSGASF
ncbi:hypothetical protein COCCADRAFT_32906 [Bipolaris zeicola 26-R-13]|uniref:Zn(2)-C6 fungal-type domain-containing protein n=1 Tax=Cochliobolus carbonum (strain 26-R-13) TaxID=930089 RepID=W6YK28_COCC2|nr:uncharacterized protein COCCADRAFT_32906 [Bipolaris zeicola 26-R-13]EUC38023.1 hypothetical protein COCCADRAFT_32906 [Bipolaris zeicola 26-R-13]